MLSPDPTGATSAARVGCGTRFGLHGGVSQPSATYEQRMPSQRVVYQVVRDHFETFRAQAAGLRDGEGLPRSVEQAAFARSATASHAEALAEAGVSRVAALRVPGGRLCAFSL